MLTGSRSVRSFWLVVASLLIGLCTPPAKAQVNNPDFELAIGLGPTTGGAAPGTWQALGNCTKIGNCVIGGPGPGVPPFKNANQCQLTTDSTTPKPTRSRDYSHWQNDRLIAPFGYNDWRVPAPNAPYGWIGTGGSGSLNVWYHSVNEPLIYWSVSGIKQQISVNKDDVLKVKYRFLTNDSVGPTRTKRNKAFFCIPDWGGSFGYFKELASNISLSSPANNDTLGTGFKYDSGWLTYSRSFPQNDNLTIMFGVIDTYTNSLRVSALLVDDVTISAPGVTVTPSSGAPVLTVEEGQPGQSLDVVLDTKPGASVTVTLTPNAQLMPPPVVLTFTPANWNTPQQVIVTAFDDALVEGNHTGTLTIKTAGSTDAIYNALPNSNYVVNIIDNDTPGIKVTYPNGSLNCVEGGQKDSYQVELYTKPASNVTLTLSSPDGQVQTDKGTLTFTPGNWNVKQTVVVTAIDDNLPEGNHTGTIRHVASSADINYNFATAMNPDLSVDSEVNIADNPNIGGGEGSYGGSGGPGGGEGSFGFGFGSGRSTAKPGPVILREPTRHANGGFIVHNVAHSGQAMATDAPASDSGAATALLVAALSAGLTAVLTLAFWRRS